MAGSKVKINIVGDASQLNATLGKTEGKLKGFGSKLGGMAKFMGPLAVAGGGMAAFGFLKDSTLEAQALNSAMAKTKTILETTGAASGKTAKGLADAAGKLELKIGVDDGEIIDAQNVLLTFTNVAGKEFDRATGLAFDMASVLGGDATSASKQLGKALNNPIKGMAMLGKAGVQFTDQQKAQIKTMQESGDVAGAQNIMLKEMERQFGGTAEASADSTAKLGILWGNVKEEVGGHIIAMVDKATPFIMKFADQIVPKIGEAASKAAAVIGPIIQQIVEWFTANWPQIQTTAVSVMSAVGGALATAGKALMVFGQVALPVIKALATAFNALPGPAKKAVVGLGALALAAPKIGRGITATKAFASSVKTIGSTAISAGRQMGTAAVSVAKFTGSLAKSAASGVVSGIKNVGGAAASAGRQMATAATSVAKFTAATAKTAAGAAVNGIKALGAAAKVAGTNFLGGVKAIGQWIAVQAKAAASAIANTASIVAQKVAMLAGKVATGIATAAQWLWNAALTANPIGLVIAAIVGIVAALVLAYNKVGWFKDFVNAAFKAISTAVGAVIGFIKEHWRTIVTILTGPIGIAVRFVMSHWDKIKAGFQAVRDFIGSAIGWIVSTFQARWNVIAAVARTLVNGIKAGWSATRDAVVAVVGRIVSVVSGIKNRVTGVLRAVFDPLRNAASSIGDFVKARIDSLVSIISGIKNRFGGIKDALSAPFRAAFNFIADAWNHTLGGFKLTVPDIKGLPGRGETFGFPTLQKFHSGGVIPGRGERDVTLMGGEGVFTRDQMAALGVALRSGGSARSGGGAVGGVMTPVVEAVESGAKTAATAMGDGLGVMATNVKTGAERMVWAFAVAMHSMGQAVEGFASKAKAGAGAGGGGGSSSAARAEAGRKIAGGTRGESDGRAGPRGSQDYVVGLVNGTNKRSATYQNWRTMSGVPNSANIKATFPNGLIGDWDQDGAVQAFDWEEYLDKQDKFHSGGIVPGRGERPATLMGGEGVFTRDQMAALGGGGSAPTASSRPIIVQMVTPDGRVLAEQVLPGIRAHELAGR